MEKGVAGQGITKGERKLLSGMQIYHNFFRQDEKLSGISPAEAYGIVIDGENTWRMLIRNTS
jgi:hypothetical protein